MPTSVAPRIFDPARATPEEWGRYHRFRRRRHAESDPDEPFEPDRLNEVMVRREDPQTIMPLLLADTGEEVVALATLYIPRPGSPGFESNRGILQFNLDVLKEHRGRGVARGFLPEIARLAREHECRVIGSDAHLPEGRAALERFGFVKKFDARHHRLDLEALDWAMVERWAAEGARRSPSRRIDRYPAFPPPALWPEYSVAVTELFNSIPWEGLDHGDIVFTPEVLEEQLAKVEEGHGRVISFLVREANGRISGMTEVALFEEQPEHAWQWLTAVDRAVQGQGIGRWIKAEMLLHLREHHPRVRWILTDNAGSNAPMLKINLELGFETYRVTSAYQMPFDEFAAKVAR